MYSKNLFRYSLLTTLVAFLVVLLGAFVRLSDAGLGCPDWPGCYGQLAVPESPAEQEIAAQQFPGRPLEADKAWKEMVHRYLAGSLGLLILGLAVIVLRGRKGSPPHRDLTGLSISLVALVIFQALLGMWTVTLLVKPLIVTLHLLFGFITTALLWWVVLKSSGVSTRPPSPSSGKLRRLTLLALAVLILQILLGGWTSTNYAALACVAFPGCLPGDPWPAMHLGDAFQLWRGLGINYEYGVLDSETRGTIHMVHRLGAFAVLLIVGPLGVSLVISGQDRALRRTGMVLIVALLVQLLLGISNVLAALPLPVAVAHNGGALFLLLTLLTLIYLLTEVTVD